MKAFTALSFVPILLLAMIFDLIVCLSVVGVIALVILDDERHSLTTARVLGMLEGQLAR